MHDNKPVILNVDDDSGARCAKSRTLRHAGYRVLEAVSGRDALAQVRLYAPDLVLLDMQLPDLDGLEVCRRIKQDDAGAAVLVLQPGGGDSRALDSGADNYLSSPVDAGELVANVRALLRLGRVRGELRESEERFRQMAENSADVFWIFSPRQPALLYVNPAYDNVWGHSSLPLYADFMSWIGSVHPQDRARVAAAFDTLAQSRSYDLEFRIVRPDGSIRWIHDRIFPVYDDCGQFYRAARISQDISSRKDRERLQIQGGQRQDEFLATLAHELRNPLGPMRSAVELLRLSEGDAFGGLHIDAREVLGRQIDHLSRLVDDLLDVARITQDKLRLRLEPVELKRFVFDALDIARPFLDSRRHRLDVSLPDAEIWMEGDAVRLAQVIANLLHNAAKYTERGGVVGLRVRVVSGRLRIIVEDTGIGIAASELRRVFDFFTQAGRCSDQAQEGLGVGLSLVKKLVELHGGQVEAFSAGPGQGSRFVVELPLAGHSQPLARTPTRPRVGQSSNALRILLVDDSIDAVTLLQALLARLGYAVETACDGLSALKKVRQFRPQIALLDIGLPGMDGYELARALRRMPELKPMTLVALTGYGQERDRQAALAAGFSHHLVKPLDLDELRTLLDAAERLAVT